MQFTSDATNILGPVRLQFYSEPPLKKIAIDELESLAVSRLKALKVIETVGQDFVRGTKNYEEHVTKELSKLPDLGRSFTFVTSQSKTAREDIDRDVTSHFILQVAYCRNDDLRRWFIQQEVDLFRYRFNCENVASTSNQVIDAFLRQNNLHFELVSQEECQRLKDKLIAGTAAPGVSVTSTQFFKVYFTDIPDLIRHRRVYLERGFAYVPINDLVTLVASRFRAALSQSLGRLSLALHSSLVDEETRILPLLAGLSKRYLGDDYSVKAPVGHISADKIDDFAKDPGHFPPCMLRLHDALKTDHHLRHQGRLQYTLFLKGIGLTMEESLKYFRKSFAPKVDAEAFAKNYAYNIRHSYGKEGKRIDYTPYSCVRIINGPPPAAGETHGCPFRHMDVDLLRQRLSSNKKMTSDSVNNIVKYSKDSHYHLACREYFKVMNELTTEQAAAIVISHPNQFFEEAQKLREGKGVAAIKQEPHSVRRVKVAPAAGTASPSATQWPGGDEELSLIDSSLME